MRYNTNILSIESWWAAMSGAEHAFWGVSIIFSVLFFFQFVLSLFGLEFESDGESELDNTATNSVATISSVDSDFAWLSVRSIIAFFTFFGWAGTIALSNGASLLIALVSATIAGTIAMLVVAYILFRLSKSAQAANADMDEALHKTGEVYLTIPGNKEGQGKIYIQVGTSLREVDAITEHLTTIPIGTLIRVTEVIDNDLLLVEPKRAEPVL